MLLFHRSPQHTVTTQPTQGNTTATHKRTLTLRQTQHCLKPKVDPHWGEEKKKKKKLQSSTTRSERHWSVKVLTIQQTPSLGAAFLDIATRKDTVLAQQFPLQLLTDLSLLTIGRNGGRSAAG